MLFVSQKQAGQRWDIITPPLREALFSDVNADFVWNLCQSEHLTEEKSYQVAEISGYVLLGFLHPEDLAGELVSSVDLPIPLAKTISDQINSRVFVPIRVDLDKVYSPLSKSGVAPMGLDKKTFQDVGVLPKLTTTPANALSTSIPKPTTFSDIGWSKQSPAPMSAATPPVPRPPVSQAPAEPAPMMLHEDTSFKAVEKNAGFTLPRQGSGAEVNMNRGGAAQTPQRPAVLEFGPGSSTLPPKPPAAGPQTTNYTGLRPSLSSMPTANTGPRSVSQIAPAAPVASIPIPKPPTTAASMITPPIPRPPQAPPQPPTPPQGNKPVVKNFT